MKFRIFAAAVLIIAAAFAGRWMTRSSVSGNLNVSGREVTRKTFTLDAGARVEVRGINGPVEIKTADTNTADVQVVRTGGADALANSNLTIEGSASSLVVSCENNGGRGFFRWLWGSGNVRQEVTLTLPRRVDLLTKGVNGPVEVGEIDGPVSVEGVNGRVEVAGASEHVFVRGVNGQVKFAVARLGSEGVDIKGVNGNVEVRFRELINADIDVKGNNGGMTLNVPNVTMQEREGRSNMRARLGTGGAQIDLKGVNGQIRFESDATATVTNTATTTTATTTNATTGYVPVAPEDDEDDSEPPAPPAPPAR